MRPIERIPIVMNLMFSTIGPNRPVSEYLITRFVGRNYPIIFSKRYDIMYYWMQNPDQRLGQVLTNLELVPRHVVNNIYNIEEDDWLIQNGYCNIEDVKFWTSYLDVNNQRLTVPQKKLLKNLDIDHVKNIIKFFEDKGALSRLDGKYLEYFDERIYDDERVLT